MDHYNLKISSHRLIIMKDMNRKGKTVATVSVSFGSDQWMLPSRWKGHRTDMLSSILKGQPTRMKGEWQISFFSNDLIFISAIFL